MCGRLGFFKAFLLAIPFYFLWNYFAPIYLATLPPQYLDVPFWHVVGVFALITIVRRMLFGFRHRWGGWHHHHHMGWGGWAHRGYGYHRFNHPGHRFNRRW